MLTRPKDAKLVYLPVILVLLLLAALAVFAEWEYDEAWTFVSTGGLSIQNIISYNPYYYANNHLLNSLWFKLLQQFSLYQPIYYRLLSLLMYMVFCQYILKIARAGDDSKQPGIWIAVFCLLPFIPYFASGRGYSIAIAMFAGAYYYYLRHEMTRQARDFFLFILLACLSSIAIFSFLYAGLSLYLLYLYKEIKRLKGGTPAYLAIRAAISILLLATIIYVYYAGSIINKNDVNIIGAPSLIKGTVSSLVSFICLQGKLSGLPFAIARGMFLLSLLPVVFIIIKKRLLYDEFIMVLIVLLLLIVSHSLTGSLYPMGRSVAYLVLMLYLGLYRAYSRHSSVFFNIHFAVIILLGLVHFSYLLRTASLPTAEAALKTVQENGAKTLYMDMPNDNAGIYNEYVFDNDITITRYNKTQQFTEHIPEMEYCLLFRPASIEAVKQHGFERVMRTQGGELYRRR